MALHAFLFTLGVLISLATPVLAAGGFAKGDLVRLTRSETLLFAGKNFLGAPKGQEFSVLKHDPGQSAVHVAFYKEDGSLIAVTLPAEALELTPPDAWTDLLKGVEAFRDQRFDEAKRRLLRAAQDEQFRSLATTLAARTQAVTLAPPTVRNSALQALRETAAQLAQLGYPSLALPLEEGVDRLGVPAAPPSKVERASLVERVTVSTRAVWRTRQAVALHRLTEAATLIAEGLAAEPARPELKALHAGMKRELEEAEDNYQHAEKMRTRGPKGVIHALSAIEDGLKRVADHPQLRAMKKQMQTAFETRTAPPVTPAFLTATRTALTPQRLEEGHRLYTTRCTECHELELLDSRTASGWQRTVAGMARRAGLNDAEQARITDYIAAAQAGLAAADD